MSSVRAGGDYLSPEISYLAADLGFSTTTTTVTLYVEGITASTDYYEIAASVLPNGFSSDLTNDAVVSDAISIAVIEGDLAPGIDDAGEPDGAIDDAFEYAASSTRRDQLKGLIVQVSDADYDQDGVPDFADGFNQFGNEGPDAASFDNGFVLSVVGPRKVLEAGSYWLSYDASAPTATTTTATPANSPYDPIYLAPTDTSQALRIWNRPGYGIDSNRNVSADLAANGNFVPSGQQYAANELFLHDTEVCDEWWVCYTETRTDETFYIEPTLRSASWGDHDITFSFEFSDSSTVTKTLDQVMLSFVQTDLDVDSDNQDRDQDGVPLDRSVYEDHFEAIVNRTADPATDLPGLQLTFNNGDADEDGIVDFADWTFSAKYAPVVIELPEPFNPSEATVRFDYVGISPELAWSEAVAGQPLWHASAANLGGLRLWNRDGEYPRIPLPKHVQDASNNDGDYLAPNVHYSWDSLGTAVSSRVHEVYLETVPPIREREHSVAIYVDPDGPYGLLGEVAVDLVKATANNDTTVSLFATNAYAAEPDNDATPATDLGAFTVSRGEGTIENDLVVTLRVVEDPSRVQAIWDFNDLQLPAGSEATLTPINVDGSRFDVTIPSGHSSVTVNLVPPHNASRDWDRVIEFELVDPQSDPSWHLPPSQSGGTARWEYVIDPGNSRATITILDNDFIAPAYNQNADIVSTGEAPLSVSDGVVDIGLRDGDVRIVTTPGTSAYSPTYVGQHGIFPIALVDLVFPGADGNFNAANSLSATFTFADRPPVTYNYAQVFDTSQWYRFAFQADASDLPTGHYDYDVVFSYDFTDDQGVAKNVTRTFRDSMEVYNRNYGWWVPGLDQLTLADGFHIHDQSFSTQNPPFEQSRTAPLPGNPWSVDLDASTYRLAQQGAKTETGAALIRSDNSSGWFVASDEMFGLSSLVDDETDTSGNYSDTVHWHTGSGEGGFRGDYRYLPAFAPGELAPDPTLPNTRTASWQLQGLVQSDTVQLFATWTPGADRASDAVYRIHGARPLGRLTNPTAASYDRVIDQRFTPGETTIYDHAWRSLGFFTVTDAANVRIELLGSEAGVTVADSVLAVTHWNFTTPNGSFSNLEHNAQAGATPPANFIHRDKYGTRTIFDQGGIQTDTYDRFDNNTNFSYSASAATNWTDSLQMVTEQGGLQTVFTYASGPLTNVRDNVFRTTSYAWNGSTLTVTEPDPDHGQPGPVTWDFDYNAEGMLESITDPNGNMTHLDYDLDLTRASTITSAQGSDVETTWRVTPTVVDAHVVIVRDDNDATYTDGRTNAWTYTTDSYGYITSETNPSPFTDTWQWDRNDDGLVTVHSEPAGGGGMAGFEDELETLYLDYDDNGNAQKIQFADHTDAIPRVASYTFDPNFSLVTSSTDADGRRITFRRDSRGTAKITHEHNRFGPDRLTRQQVSAGPSTILDLPGGLPLYQTEAADSPDQVTAKVEYFTDPIRVGLAKQVTSALGTSVESYVEFDYDNRRNVHTTTDELGRVVTTIYDELDRLVQTNYPDPGTADHGLTSTKNAYDPAGNVIKTYDARSLALAAADQYFTEYEYDEQNRLEYVTLPAPGGHSDTPNQGLKTQFAYDANDNIVDEILHLEASTTRTTTHEYDERNLRTSTTLQDPNYDFDGLPWSAPQTPVTYFGYDTRGNPKYETNPRQLVLDPAAFPTDPNDSVEVAARSEEPAGPGKDKVRTEYTYDKIHRVVDVRLPNDPDAQHEQPIIRNHYLTTQSDGKSPIIGHVVTSPGPGWDTSPQLRKQSETIYDDLGHVIFEIAPVDAQGNRLVTEYAYNRRGNVTDIVLGSTSQNGNTAPTGVATKQYYDFQDRLIGTDHVDPETGNTGLITLYAYNEIGEQVRELTLEGNLNPAVHFLPDGARYHTTAAHLDGLYAGVANDESARLTNYEYDRLGRVVLMVAPDPDIHDDAVAAVETVYAYDQNSNVTDTMIHFAEDVNGDGAIADRQTNASEWSSLTTTREFDKLDRPWRTLGQAVDVGGMVTRPLAEVSYNIDGSVHEQHELNVRPNRSDETRTTTFIYDGLGRLHKTQLPDVNGDRITHVQYLDAIGNTIITFQQSAGISSPQYTYHTYDRLNRPVSSETPIAKAVRNGTTELDLHVHTWLKYHADGTMRSTFNNVDGLDEKKIFAYDNMGRLLSETQYVDSSPGITSKFTYDVFGNRIRFRDPVDNVISYARDNLGRVTVETAIADKDGDLSPDNDQWMRTFHYDAFGNLIQRIDRNNQTIQFTYNDIGQKTNETWYETSGLNTIPVPITSNDPIQDIYQADFTYTPLGEIENASDQHRDTAMPGLGVIYSDNSEYAITYDALRRVDTLTQTLDVLDSNMGVPLPVVFDYDYDLVGNEVYKFVSIGSNPIALFDESRQYDPLDRLTSVHQSAGIVEPKSADYLYSGPFLDEIQRTGGPDLVPSSDYTFLPDGRFERVIHQISSDPALLQFKALYDAKGRVQQHQTGTDAEASISDVEFDYDPTNQIISKLDSSDSIVYARDANGNRGDVAALNRVTSDEEGTYSFDAEGNVVARLQYHETLGEDDGPIEWTLNPFVPDITASGIEPGWFALVVEGTALPTSFDVDLEMWAIVNGTPHYDSVRFQNLTTDNTVNHYFIYANPNHWLFNYTVTAELSLFSAESLPANGRISIRRFDDRTLSWDHQNRLTKVEIYESTAPAPPNSIPAVHANGVPERNANTSTEVTYKYDVLGNRISRTVTDNGEQTGEFFVSEGGQPLLAFDGNQQLVQQHVFGRSSQELLVVEDFDEDGGAVISDRIIWTLPDDVGSIRGVYASGVTEIIEFDEFGAPDPVAEDSLASSVSIVHTGQVYDPLARLYMTSSHYYDPFSTRLVSENPGALESGETNPYRFAGNSPTNFRDSRGLSYEVGEGFFGYDMDAFFNSPELTKVWGGVQGVFGALQVAAGTAACATGIGCLVGAPVILRGLDDFQAGAITYVTGELAHTATYAAALAITGSETAALATDIVTGLLSPTSAVGIIRASAKLSRLGRFARAGKQLSTIDEAIDLARIGRRGSVFDDIAGPQCLNSFVPGTLVLMADGTPKPIEEVEIGDWVWATDPETGEAGARQVTSLIYGDGEKELVDIEIDGAILTATDNHPFWVVNVGAWIDARDLQVGDIVLADDGQQLTIDNVKPYSLAFQVVHNLTVDDLHTYYVVAGSESVLVHNCKVNPWTTAAKSNAPNSAVGQSAITARRLQYRRLASELDNAGGHSFADHGAWIPEHLYYRRLTTGITPGGSVRSIPGRSGSFATHKVHGDAYQRAMDGLWKNRFNAKGTKLKKQVEVEFDLPGAGFSYSLDASGRMVRTKANKVFALFRQNSGGGYNLVTMYPIP